MHNVRTAVWVLCLGVLAPGLTLLSGWWCERARRQCVARGIEPSWWVSWQGAEETPWPKPPHVVISRIRQGVVAQSALGMTGACLWALLMLLVTWREGQTNAEVALWAVGAAVGWCMSVVCALLAFIQDDRLRQIWKWRDGPVRSAMDGIGAAWSVPFIFSATFLFLFPPLWAVFWMHLTVWNGVLARIWERVGAATGSAALEAAAGQAAKSWRICFLASVLLMVSLVTMFFRSANMLFPVLLAIPLPLFGVYATVHLCRALRLAAEQFAPGATTKV